MSAALVAIGTPSIPAVIRNLENSDDAKVRQPSLNVLVRIEGDKDVVQLRLQKALDAQSDTTKKARLQLALKSLTESPSNK
jgi:HEAT repeat protein